MLKALTAVGAVAAAAILLLPTASLASTSSTDIQAETATASYGDLNLSSQAGVDAFRGRVREAARQVCGLAAPAPLAEIQFNRECVAGAIASAQPAFDEVVASARHGIVTVGTGASLVVTAPAQ